MEWERAMERGRKQGYQWVYAQARQIEKEFVALEALREGLSVSLIVKLTGLPEARVLELIKYAKPKSEGTD